MTTRVTIKDTGELRPLAGLRFQMTAGIHATEAAQPHSSGMTIGDLAMLHEFGKDKIPARMWLRRWCQRQMNAVAQEIRGALIPMARKQNYRTAGPAGLKAVANHMKATMRGAILGGGITPKNAPATLARKAPEARPLLEHGELVAAAEAEIKGITTGWRYNTRGGMGP